MGFVHEKIDLGYQDLDSETGKSGRQYVTPDGARYPSVTTVLSILKEKEIAEWDLDVRPDGTGLPKGKGTVKKGEIIYAAKCGFCHGQKGEGGINDRLVARIGEEFPNEDQACGFQCRTIGNYWPYATTLFDYILRSMPMNAPGSLTNDEVYSLSAYLLYLNKIVSEEIELNSENLKNIVMPAHDKFVVDDRLDYLVAH